MLFFPDWFSSVSFSLKTTWTTTQPLQIQLLGFRIQTTWGLNSPGKINTFERTNQCSARNKSTTLCEFCINNGLLSRPVCSSSPSLWVMWVASARLDRPPHFSQLDIFVKSSSSCFQCVCVWQAKTHRLFDGCRCGCYAQSSGVLTRPWNIDTIRWLS